MRRFLSIAVALCFIAGPAFAAAPDKVSIPNKKGEITFPHAAHVKAEADCTKCHATKEGGKIEAVHGGMSGGHKLCGECHQAGKPAGAKADVKNSATCKGCHSGAPKA